LPYVGRDGGGGSGFDALNVVDLDGGRGLAECGEGEEEDEERKGRQNAERTEGHFQGLVRNIRNGILATVRKKQYGTNARPN
jgi:hypothetical protein